MAKTKVEIFCYSCDVGCDVRFSEEETFLHPVHCPFCGDEVEADDDDREPDDEDEENEDRRDRF